jgi:Thiolase C-terminal domain-like
MRSPKDVDVAQIYDGFSASVIYGLESYGFCREGKALDFIQDGRIELAGDLPLNTFGGSLSTGRIHGLWHIIEGRSRHPAARASVRSRTFMCRSSARARRSFRAPRSSSSRNPTDHRSARRATLIDEPAAASPRGTTG